MLQSHVRGHHTSITPAAPFVRDRTRRGDTDMRAAGLLHFPGHDPSAIPISISITASTSICISTSISNIVTSTTASFCSATVFD